MFSVNIFFTMCYTIARGMDQLDRGTREEKWRRVSVSVLANTSNTGALTIARQTLSRLKSSHRLGPE